MKSFSQFISEQIELDGEFEELYKEAKLEEKLAIDLIRLRKEANLTQTELAKKLKVEESYISKVENADIMDLTLAELSKYANALGVEVVISFEKK
jgi:predicted XRE-type DNA-binding protein